MKKSHIVSILMIFLSLTVIGCQDSIDKKLAVADANIECAPDSMLQILQKINPDSIKESQRARLYLLLAKATTKAQKRFKSDSLIAIAEQYYEGRKDSLEVQSKLYYGMTLYGQERYEEAIVVLTLAYDLAHTLEEYRYSGIAARELYYLYRQLFVVEQELYWAEKAKEDFIKGDFKVHAVWIDKNIIDALLQNGRQEEALRLIEYIDSVKPANERNFITPIRYYKAEALHALGQPEKALEIYEALLEEKGRLGSSAWYRMALDYRATDRKGKMAMAVDSARWHAKSNLDSMWVTDLEAKLAADRGDYRSAYELAVRFGEEIMRDGDRRIGHPVSTALTDALREKYAVEQALHESQRRTMWLTVAVGILGFLLLTGVIRILILRLRDRRRELDTMALKVEALTRDLSNLTELSDRKDRKSTEAISGLLGAHTRTLDRLCTIWFRQPDSREAGQVWYRELLRELESLRSEERVKEMEELIDRNSDEWMARFRTTFPGLTAEQYRLAMYLFLGFSNESMAILMDKSQVNTVYAAKNRLKRKLTSVDTPEAEAFCRRLRL